MTMRLCRILSCSALAFAVLIFAVLTNTVEAQTPRPPKIIAIAWSPDGSKIAAGGANGTLFTRDPSTGQTITTFQGLTAAVRSVAWSPDSRKIASASSDGTVQIWDAQTGKQLFSFQDYTTPAFSVVWSPDGAYIASLCLGSGAMRNALTGELVGPINSGDSYAIDWSPDGKKLAYANGGVRISDLTTGQPLPPYYYYSGHETLTFSIAWSPDGSKVAAGGFNGTVTIWDTNSHQILSVMADQTDMIYSVAWSRDGNFIAASSKDGTVRIWSTATWQLLNTYQTSNGNTLSSVTWSPDSTKLAYTDTTYSIIVAPASR